ncbi:tRNA:m(4)X modification enzyme TRM13-like protein, partial [Armadillidium nasatum]
TCFENKLSSHMKICNARERMDKPFFVKRINEGENEDDDGDASCSSSSRFKDLTDEELMEYIRKIEKIYDESIDTIELRINDHPAVGDALSRPGIGHSVIRHLKQNSSLLSLLEDKDLLNGGKDKVFVEFGAGRGKLTGWVIEAVKKKEDTLFILIDKGSQRYKIDAKLKHDLLNPSYLIVKYFEVVIDFSLRKFKKIKRLRVDIQDLDLSRVEGIEENSEIVVCGKHLCGAATDFSLRCITNCGKGSTCGIVIALCCHHRCTWKAYVGKKFLKEVGFSGKDFPVLVSLSSWAVSGSRQSVVNKEQLELSDEEKEIPSTPEPNINENRYERMGLSIDYRESIGRKVKAIIDHGRVEYVNNNHDLKSTLVQYVEQISTLENIALVAYGNTL